MSEIIIFLIMSIEPFVDSLGLQVYYARQQNSLSKLTAVLLNEKQTLLSTIPGTI